MDGGPEESAIEYFSCGLVSKKVATTRTIMAHSQNVLLFFLGYVRQVVTKSEIPSMGDYSVSSPRRILSLSNRNRYNKSFLDPDENVSGFPVSVQQHGPKPSEVYGFVGSISVVMATVFFLMWAYIPECWLHTMGITYYPSKYWALAVPTYAMVTVVLAMGFYIGQNFMAPPPPTSLTTIFDEYSREPSSFIASLEDDEQPIEPISDIGIDRINDLMFNTVN